MLPEPASGRAEAHYDWRALSFDLGRAFSTKKPHQKQPKNWALPASMNHSETSSWAGSRLFDQSLHSPCDEKKTMKWEKLFTK